MAEATEFDEAAIERLVRAFYDKVRRDALLGPVFAARIADWEPHLAQIVAFWSSIAFGPGRYQGHPMRKHLPLPIDGRHFDRWIALFDETARESCPPAAAAFLVDRARRIGESFELGIAGTRGVLLMKGQRLPPMDVEAGPRG